MIIKGRLFTSATTHCTKKLLHFVKKMATKDGHDNLENIRQNLSTPSLSRQFYPAAAVNNHDSIITVLQWNILAQGLHGAEGNFIRITNPDVVNYEIRKWRILEQILIYQPDLCALEEVDIYDKFLKHELPKYK
ncbi:unnamed protein product [Didymodactylos carnosus]|uniref:Nocturnin n=1 Tax=Didymodactylos carnosus TaxID=1234261 RepID=A0A814MH97_9BILA|nr:unnamed protein product [Didymodactylos carnosus]CAF1491112.1 unnamed protein product [Didymodactylos carnosus]CAF3844604.1 unnamed protein product [Didymodactylos carnosus]CAF4280343.1 unnamed protein product [Didymodactylos carnosus]